VQTLDSAYPLPSDELMVLWTEASAFFPFLQFSYFPWNYAAQTEQVILGYARAHKSLEGYLAEQAKDRRAGLDRDLSVTG
jgi:alpha-glucosidase (family GH31 glycosyl hydrolase)